jgi:uncharacterized protein (DUF2147 family)
MRWLAFLQGYVNVTLPATTGDLAIGGTFMRRRQFTAWLIIGASLAGLPVRAAEPLSPIGHWRTIDDATGKPKGIVRIFDHNGALYGVVEKSLVTDAPSMTCDQCGDDRKGKPIIGLDVIRGLKPDGDAWDGGTILEPETGKVYRCSITLRDGGQKLAVRGYIGVSLIGRTQVWERVN